MTSSFESDFFGASAWSVLASQHAETVTITPQAVGVGPFTISAIFQGGRVIDGPGEPRELAQFGVLLVKPANVPGWTPAQGDAVAIGSADYKVESHGTRDALLEIQIATTDGS